MKGATKNESKNRLVIVSNRLPLSISKDGEGLWQAHPGSGGLVTALAPVLRHRGGLWIGWPGTTEGDAETIKKLLHEATDETGYHFQPVMLTAEEVNLFYYGFANEVLWPLFHDLQTRCNFDPAYWNAYQDVNRKFARVVADNLLDGDHIWIHDYHLMTAARELRQMGNRSTLAYFLHIPFPPLDLFLKLPWRFQILEALLAYDLIGFQTLRDRRNFVQCVRTIYKDTNIRGKGQVLTAAINGREVRIGHFPISIDFEEFASSAEKKSVTERARAIKEDLAVRHIVLGIDRLDYTKGIPERLSAFKNVLLKYPELHGQISLFQLVVPSRVNIPKYNELKEEIERSISEINGRFTRPGWTPIHYMYRSISRSELLAFYRAADIALITPLKDGMNLVAKEYCAANVEENGILILSEFAGATAQLNRGALLVNPYDVESVAETILFATRLDYQQRRRRMQTLRRNIRRQDIYWWVESFFKSVYSHDLKVFPQVNAFIPLPSMTPYLVNWI